MLSSRRIASSLAAQRLIGFLAANFLRLVWYTNRVVIEPGDIYERVESDLPLIIAMWHGQHFMVPFISRRHAAKVLVSRHRDGEINASAARQLGIGVVRGSGAHGGRFDVKGGVGGFTAMMQALADGYNMALTADVPKISRRAGLGIVKLAKLTQRPVYPVAVVTSRRWQLRNWDRTTINLPFGRMAIVTTDPVEVPADADDAALEHCRLMIQERLDWVHERGYAIVDRKIPIKNIPAGSTAAAAAPRNSPAKAPAGRG